MSENPRLRRAVVAAALVGLAALAPACGDARDSDGEVDRIGEEITAMEQLLRDSSGGDRTEACVSYAVVCERAASVCLLAQRASTRDRCGRIGNRCERNLSQYCGGVSPRIDAGWTADASSDSRYWQADAWMHDAYWHADASSDSRYWQADAWVHDAYRHADASSDSRYWWADAWTDDAIWRADSSPDSHSWHGDVSTDAPGER